MEYKKNNAIQRVMFTVTNGCIFKKFLREDQDDRVGRY